MDRTTLSRNLRPLARQGLIALHSADDRRVKTAEVTAQGKRVPERAIPLCREAQQN